jgi:hypothetical protein
MLILEIDNYYIKYIGIVLNNIERIVIDLKSIILEHYHEYLNIYGEVATSQLLLR